MIPPVLRKLSLASLATALALLPLRAHPATPEERQAAAAELGALAPRIEALKRQVAEGRGGGSELPALLQRAQELAAVAETSDAPARPASTGPDAQELRERADLLRDQADRVSRQLGEVELRLEERRRQAALAARLDALDADLFAEAAPRRVRSGDAAPALSNPGAPPTPPVPVAGGHAVPAGTSREPLSAMTGDDLPALRRRRAELATSLASLRSRTEALEALARAAEAGR